MVEKIKKEKSVKKDSQFNDSQLTELKSILTDAFGGDSENGGIDTNSIKELETAKLILAIITDSKNLDSTTNLNEEEIEDLANARYLNLIFNDELIDEFCIRYESLKRSQTKESKNLLNILAEITGKVNDSMVGSSGFSRILGDRFKSR